MSDTAVLEQNSTSAVDANTLDVNDLDQLLNKSFNPKSDSAQEAISTAVKSMAEIAIKDAVVASDNILGTIESMISAIDKKLSDQLNEIIHHEKFRELEGKWRGLDYLVNNTETDEYLKLKVLNISKAEVDKEIKKYKGTAWDQSALFKQLYEEEYGTAGGEPYGCLVGDYYFSHNPQDIAWLRGISQVAAAAHTPFIAGSDPRLFNMDSWQELSNPRDLTKILQTAEYASWKSLRASEDSKYIGLTMPRFLSRLPYSQDKNPVEEFVFEENINGADHDKFVWSNAAYAMALNINQAFKTYGWCTQIRGAESGGVVEGLPCHTFGTDDGGVDMKCPTEIAITDRREAELSKAGLLPLIHWKNTDYAVFIGAQSLNQPKEFEDPDATANANLSARLPYMFAICRFAHYLKCMVRDKIGSFTTEADLQNYLSNWINRYVVNSNSASDQMKANYPLGAAEVVVNEDLENPGYYSAKFFLKPHYQLEGLTVSLRLTSKLPSEK
jgi:type VI secretion system protein ImpC